MRACAVLVWTHLAVRVGSLRPEDLNEHPCSSCGVCLSHDVFDVLFDGLFSNFKSIGYFFICPSLGKILHYRLLSVCKLESFFGLIRIELLAAAQFLKCDHEACILDSASIRKPKTSKEYGLIGISCNSLNLKLLPVLCLRANLEGLHYFGAEFGEGRRKYALGSLGRCAPIFSHIDEF